jgi:hypothetical protein
MILFANWPLLAPCCVFGGSPLASQLNEINIDRRAFAQIDAHHTVEVAAPVSLGMACAWLIQSCKRSTRIHV